MRHSRGRTDLTEEQWLFISPIIPIHTHPSGGKRGRPWRSDREILNGVLWILRTGAAWEDLPSRYPPRATCHRRFQQWSRDGTLRAIFNTLVDHLDQKNKIHWQETFVDGSLVPAKKGVRKRSQRIEDLALESWPLWTPMDSLLRST